jgi:hypothetical protein
MVQRLTGAIVHITLECKSVFNIPVHERDRKSDSAKIQKTQLETVQWHLGTGSEGVPVNKRMRG